jgi:hypothetical protein
MPVTSRVELYAAIRRDARAGMSGRAIERKHGVGYRTVAQALGSAWPQKRKEYATRPSRLDPFKAAVDEILLADLDARRKQRHTNLPGSISVCSLGRSLGAVWVLAVIAAEFGAIYEHQAAVIEGDCPSSTRIGNVLAADIDAIASVVAEIVDNDSRAFVAGAGVDTHPAAHCKVGRRGGVG